MDNNEEIHHILTPEQKASQYIEGSEFSLRAISQKTGISRSKLSNLGRAPAVLSVSEAWRLGECLGFDPSALFPTGPSLQASSTADEMSLLDRKALEFANQILKSTEQRMKRFGGHLTLEDVAAWHEWLGDRIVEDPNLSPFLTLIKPMDPTMETLPVQSVGDLSVTALALGKTSASAVRRYIGDMDARNRAEIVSSYVEAARSGQRQYFERKAVIRTTEGDEIELRYLTLLMTLSSGVIVNYSSVFHHSASSPGHSVAGAAGRARALPSRGAADR